MKYKRRKFVIRVSDKWRGESGVALFYFIQRGHYVQFGVDMCTINFCWYNQNKYPPKNYPSPTLRKQYNSSKIQKCWLCCVKTFQLELVYLLHMVLLFVKVAFSTRAEWTKQFCKFWNRVWKLPQDPFPDILYASIHKCWCIIKQKPVSYSFTQVQKGSEMNLSKKTSSHNGEGTAS